MSYLVLARKYRPETFDDVVGQESASRTLRNAISQGRIAHAFLFSGPRGVGKTSMARILSKALNCKEGPTTDPCMECEICKAITAGSSMDVIEIDAASNRGIDNIRTLRENVRYAPAGSRFKVYIIDEVHMLTQESFNALLKTLEEPPDHVKFIFATTEPQKLPETVRSRCQCYEFRRISIDEIASRLEFIMKSEGAEFEPGVLHRIAATARGGMRDAQSLLDQMIAFGGNRATFEGLSELTGSLSPEKVTGIVDAILEERLADLLELVDKAFAKGTRAEDLLRELVEHYRLLLTISAGAGAESVSGSGWDEEHLRKQAASTSLDNILIYLQIALKTLRQLRWFDDERVLLELALAKMVRISSTMEIAEAASLLKGWGGGSSGGRTGNPSTASSGRSQAAARPRGGAAREKSEAAQVSPAASGAESSDLPAVFARIISEVAKKSKSTAFSLKSLKPLRLEGGTLFLEDGAAGQRLLGPDDKEVADLLAEASEKVVGRRLRFKVEPSAQEQRDESVPPIVEKARDLFEGDMV